MLLKIVLCCLAFTGSRAAKPDEMVSECKTQPSKLNSGERGEVHCFFPVDIKDKQFTVDLYKNESSDNPDTIVDCYFTETQRVCEVKDGFDFTCTPGKEQIVRVMKATKQCEGEYRCHILDLEGLRSEHCTVEYEDMKPETDPTSPLSPDVIVGPLVGAVCLLGLLVAGGFIIRRKRNERSTSHKSPGYNPVSTNLVTVQCTGVASAMQWWHKANASGTRGDKSPKSAECGNA